MTTVAEILPGTHSKMELFIRFADWSRERTNVSVRDIQGHFNVQRATAYRWLDALHSARGGMSS